MELEKQMMKNFKDKIKLLEQELEEKSDQIAVYESTRSSAEEKIQAMLKIHQDKTRSLMTSINLLKKENKKLEDMNNENQRSKLIQQLNKEIGDQDIIIETLRKLVSDEKADGAIVAALNKGPPKLRPETREELRMEVRKLNKLITNIFNNQLRLIKQKEDLIKAKEEKKQTGEEEKVVKNSQNESQVTEIDDNVNENFVNKIQELNKEVERLKIEAISEVGKIKKLESKLVEKDKELVELKSVKLDIQVINKKYEAMQEEYQKVKEKLNEKFMMGYDKEMRLEELELLGKQQEGKFKLTQKNAEMEFENLQQGLAEADLTNKELLKENEKLIIKNDDLSKANQQQTTKIKQLISNIDALGIEIQNLKQKQEEKENQFRQEKSFLQSKLNEAYSYSESLEEKLNEEKAAGKKKDQEIKSLTNNVEALSQELATVNENMIKLEQHKQETKNLGPLGEENAYLKQTQKKLRIEQIQLQEQLEDLQLQLRLKVGTNMSQYPTTIAAKLHEREKEKLSQLGKQIVSLKKHSQELKELYIHLDSNLSSSLAKQSEMENFKSDSNYKTQTEEMNSQLIDSNISGLELDNQKTPSEADSNIYGVMAISKQQSIVSSKSDIQNSQLLIKQNNELRGSITHLNESNKKISSQVKQLKQEQIKLLQKDGAFKKKTKQEDNLLYQSRVTELSKKIADMEEEQFELIHQASLANSSLASKQLSQTIHESVDSNLEDFLT